MSNIRIIERKINGRKIKCRNYYQPLDDELDKAKEVETVEEESQEETCDKKITGNKNKDENQDLNAENTPLETLNLITQVFFRILNFRTQRDQSNEFQNIR